MAAMFLRHEGFLGAMGAFLKVHPMDGMLRGGRGSSGATGAQQPGKVRGRGGRESGGAADVVSMHALDNRALSSTNPAVSRLYQSTPMNELCAVRCLARFARVLSSASLWAPL